MTADQRRHARAEAALAQGRTDFKSRAPRKRKADEMGNESAEARVRRVSELLDNALEEAAHQKQLVRMWMQRSRELQLQLDALSLCRRGNPKDDPKDDPI